MPSYGARSRGRLATAHPDLQEVFNEAIKYIDIKILEGERDEDRQNALYAEGKSQVKFPNGKHNKHPSDAIDAAPYPIKWENTGKNYERFAYMAGIIIGIGIQKGIFIRWGGDWDRDGELLDNEWDDLPHFELI